MSPVSRREIDSAQIWQELGRVQDPELPALSIVDLGIVRQAEVVHGTAHVQITPTYAGCPAWEVIRQEIRLALHRIGAESVHLETVLDPPWSSDWMSESARAKLKAFGISPPAHQAGRLEIVGLEAVACPRCGSMDTDEMNAFGPTPCRSLHRCRTCLETFEAFKPL